jgi:hypothetical protein
MPVQGKGEYGWTNGFEALFKLPRSAIDPFHTLVKNTARYPVSVEVICDSEETQSHVVDPYKFSNWFIIIVEFWSVNNEAVHILHLLFATHKARFT